MPEFEKLFTATVELGDEYALGETGRGYSEITPVTGGTAAAYCHLAVTGDFCTVKP